MTAETDCRQRLALASEACRCALTEDPFPKILQHLDQYAEPASAFGLLSQVTMSVCGDTVSKLASSAGGDLNEPAVERALLLLASQDAAGKVPALPVSERVKELFADEFEFFAKPSAPWVSKFRYDNVRFREMARIATLRRFPAGQFHWEAAALPRSWTVTSSQRFALLPYALFRLGGFSPLVELHLNERRKNRGTLLEREAKISYYRTAKSLEKQPEVKGIMHVGWMYSRRAAEVSPHLAWLRTVPQSGGAVVADLGPAPEDAGFLIGSQERRKKYEDGTYRPRIGCVVWAREELIAWANRHPVFDL
jgi:hypothetical protein